MPYNSSGECLNIKTKISGQASRPRACGPELVYLRHGALAKALSDLLLACTCFESCHMTLGNPVLAYTYMCVLYVDFLL